MKRKKGIQMSLMIILALLMQFAGIVWASSPYALQEPAPPQSGVVDGDGGAVGLHTSIKVDDEGRARISYYDSGNGHLKYVEWTGTAWEAQTVDDDGDVGQYTSLALDVGGTPRVSYYDWRAGDLKYAVWNGTMEQDNWTIDVVDEEGTVGLYTSLALDSAGNPHISYYDATNGDLKYAAWDGHAWIIETVDSGGDVGQYTSLALDQSNFPHISYYDVTNRHLKYATRQGGGWTVETADDGGDVGQYTSLAIDQSGRPRIAYRDALNLDLKYAAWTGDIWDIEIVDSAGDVGQYASLTLTSADEPRISFYDATAQHLKYAAWTGTTWDIQTVDDDREVGQYTSIALDGSDNPHISYYDAVNFDLRHITWDPRDGGSWIVSHADGAPSAGRSTALGLNTAGDPRIAYWLQNRLGYAAWNGSDAWNRGFVDENDSVGQYVSLQLNSDDPRISYYDETNGDLKYAQWVSDAWNIETVDSDGDVGRFTSLALDGSGNPRISYYDVTNGDLKYAAWTGSTWNVETVDSDGDVGKYTSLALDGSGNPRMSYYDVTNGELKYAQWTGSAWITETVDSDGDVGAFSSMVLDGSDQPHIGYFDASNGHLKYARWTGAAWDIQTVDNAPQVGSFAALALDGSGKPHISYYDGINGHLKLARWTGSEWDIQTVDDDGNVGKSTSLAIDARGNDHISYYDASNDALKYRFVPGSPGVPQIVVTPKSVSVTLQEGEIITRLLTISNVGDAPLDWVITESAGGGGARSGDRPQQRGRFVIPAGPRVDKGLIGALEAAPDGRATFLVYLTEQADLRPAYDIADWKARGEFVYQTLLETAERSQKALLADLEAQQKEGLITEYRSHFIVNAVTVTGNRAAVDRLSLRPDVARLEKESVAYIPDPIREPVLSPVLSPVEGPAEVKAATAPTAVAWGVDKIRADKVWSELGITGAGVVVANIDTGVEHIHPALTNRYRGTATGSHDFNWYDPSGTYPGEPGDNHGHGTHTMGTMVGDDGAGEQIGVAPGAQWIAAKGCVQSWCEGEHLLRAAEWILAPCPVGVAPGNPGCDSSKRPQVVNSSWSGGGGNTWYQGAVIAWRAADIFPAFSCGNEGRRGRGSLGSPGDYPESFCSGATDSDDVIAEWSSRGPSSLTPEIKPDVSSPGVAVHSSVPGGGYEDWSGTSMASPHTAGVVALLIEANPALTIEEMEQAMYRTAIDLGEEGPDMDYGYGRIDARAAVGSVMDDDHDPAPWLWEEPISGTVPIGGQQVVTLTFNASGLPADIYTATLVIDSTDPDRPTVTVPVTMTVEPDTFICCVRVSNVRDVSASVSWITTQDADGQVYFGTDPANLINVAYDDRGAGTADDVHHVTLAHLSPETTYYFYVVSNEVRDDNNGEYYQFTTGASLGIPGVDNVWGQIFKSDGTTPAADVLVYLRVLDLDGQGSVGESGLLSGLTDSNGYWIDPKTRGPINLKAVRTEDGSAYFEYSPSGDALRIEAKGGRDCDGMMQIDTGNDSPAPPMVLSCLNMMSIDIGLGWGIFVWPGRPADDRSASELLNEIQSQGGDGIEISRWLEGLGNWSGYIRGMPFGDFDVVPGEPYFLRASRRSLLRLAAGASIVPRNVIALTTGWNFVTLSPTVGRLTAEQACSQIAAQGGAVSEIDHWDADVGNWVGHICGLPFGDFEMTADEGYFVKSQSDSTWRPEGSSTAATPESKPVSQWSSGGGKLVAKGQGVLEKPTAFSGQPSGLNDSPVIHNVRISNVGDRSFTLSWLTDSPAPGYVRFGTDTNLVNIAYDDQGAGIVSQTHHVTLKDLSPDTVYYAALVSGETTDDNAGAFYQVNTGPTLGIPAVYRAYGQVFRADGVTPAAGALIYVAVIDDDGQGTEGQASLLSTITDENGYWSLNLGIARIQDGSAYFDYSDNDTLSLEAWHSLISQASQVTRVGEATPAPSMILSEGWKLYLPLVVGQ